MKCILNTFHFISWPEQIGVAAYSYWQMQTDWQEFQMWAYFIMRPTAYWLCELTDSDQNIYPCKFFLLWIYEFPCSTRFFSMSYYLFCFHRYPPLLYFVFGVLCSFTHASIVVYRDGQTVKANLNLMILYNAILSIAICM